MAISTNACCSLFSLSYFYWVICFLFGGVMWVKGNDKVLRILFPFFLVLWELCACVQITPSLHPPVSMASWTWSPLNLLVYFVFFLIPKSSYFYTNTHRCGATHWSMKTLPEVKALIKEELPFPLYQQLSIANKFILSKWSRWRAPLSCMWMLTFWLA